MQIMIKCKTALSLPYKDLHEFQGDLKELSEQNYLKISAEIKDTGFAFPPFVWQQPSDQKWYLLDGHQRIKALSRMEQEGYLIGPIPVVPVECASFKEAKRRVLQLVSQYGHVTNKGLKDFSEANDFKFEDLDSRFDFPHVEFPKPKSESKKHSSGESKLIHKCPQCGHEFGSKVHESHAQ